MIQQGLYDCSKAGVGFLKLRHGPGEGGVGNDATARIYVGSINAAHRKCSRSNFARDPLSESRDVVRSARRKFTYRHDAPQQVVQRIEFFFQLRMDLDKPARTQQIRGGIEVPLAGSAGELQRLLPVSRTGGGRHGQKLIGHFRKRADYHNRMLGKALAHNGGRPVNGFSILHRGAAKLHHDHGCTAAHSINGCIPGP